MRTRGLFLDFDRCYDASDIIITDDGKVRFLNVIQLNFFDEKADMERMNEYMDYLDRSLQRDTEWSFGDRLSYVDRGQRCDLLPPSSHPERPILGIRDILLQLQLYYIPPFDDDVFFSFVGEVGGKRKSRKKHDSMARFIAPESDGEPSAGSSTMLMPLLHW
jgi:hypothetical protein